MLDSANQRNALLSALLSLHSETVIRQARLSPGDLPNGLYWDEIRREWRASGSLNVDLMHDLILKLLTSSPDLLLPEIAWDEIEGLDAEIRELTGRDLSDAEHRQLARLRAAHDKLATQNGLSGKDRRKLAGLRRERDDLADRDLSDEEHQRLAALRAERDQASAGPWLRTVLYRMAIDHYRAENRHARIIREHAAELADLYHAGIGESAESIVMRKLAEEDMRRRILRLPPKLAQVASLRYAGYSYGEVSQILGVSEVAARKRAQMIRSPWIRRALGL